MKPYEGAPIPARKHYLSKILTALLIMLGMGTIAAVGSKAESNWYEVPYNFYQSDETPKDIVAQGKWMLTSKGIPTLFTKVADCRVSSDETKVYLKNVTDIKRYGYFKNETGVIVNGAYYLPYKSYTVTIKLAETYKVIPITNPKRG